MVEWDVSEVASLQTSSSYDLSSHGVLIVEDNLVQYVSYGGQVIKQFTCETQPIAAIFHSDDKFMDFVIVILVSASLIRIFTETGEIYDIPLSFLACQLFSSSKGIVIESECNHGRNLIDESVSSMYYVLYRPDAPYVPLTHPLLNGQIISVCGSYIAILGRNEIFIAFLSSNDKVDSPNIASPLKGDSRFSDSHSNTHYTPNNKRKLGKSSKKLPNTSPESFANALGVAGYLEARSVSPLSFARIREIGRASPFPSANISLDSELLNDHSISTFDEAMEVDSIFSIDHLAIIPLDDGHLSLSVTFSLDVEGGTLVHVLDTGTLETYQLPTQTGLKETKRFSEADRRLFNVSSISHFYLGSSARTIDVQIPSVDLFGSLIVHNEEKKMDLVIGLSRPICQYSCLSQDEFEHASVTLSPYQSSGVKKARPGNIFCRLERDVISLQNLSIPRWSWLTRRNQSHHLRRSISDKFMEVLLSAVCESSHDDPAMSALSSFCLSTLLQAEFKGNYLLQPYQILIFIASPFLSSSHSLDNLTMLILTLFPDFPARQILERFAQTIARTQIPQSTLFQFSFALFEVIHVSLEDLYLQDEQTPATNSFVAAMYIASTLFAPSYQNYYRRILSLSPSNKVAQSVDPICQRIVQNFENSKILEEKLPAFATSSFSWVVKSLQSFQSNSSQNFWSPFHETIASIIVRLIKARGQSATITCCVTLHYLLAPVITLTRNFLQSLHQVIAWFQQNQQPNTLTSFAIAFLCVCGNYPGLEDDILQALPRVIRITILHSLLNHRCDLESLQTLWIQFSLNQIQHCGFCSFHRCGWPASNSQSHSCSCNEIFSDPEQTPREIPHRILILLGREDFVANQTGRPPTKDRYQLTDTCLLGTFPNLLHAFNEYLPEEQDCNINLEYSLENLSSNSSKLSLDDQDGLLNVEKSSQSRFSEDERMHEVCRLLRSSKTIYLKVERTPEMTDAQFRQKQQSKLISLCRRSLASPVGRGMTTLNSLNPILAEPIPIPPLVLLGRCPPTNATISLDSVSVDMSFWPEYHNGVAAGLRIRRTSVVSRNWILYNRIHALSPTETPSKSLENAHAGFLLSLGLQGHLKTLSIADICDYLTRGHDLTTISMLIGLASSRIGSSDPLLSKSLCLHLPSLMYPAETASEIDISPFVQTAALVGLGLLHCSSPNRLIIEYLLTELSSPQAAMNDGSAEETKESIAISAGWSLGMLLLGLGHVKSENENHLNLDIHDLRIEDRLQQCIDGGSKFREPNLLLKSTRPKQIVDASKSSRFLEGNYINTNVTSPGAVIALTLMYLRSNNHDVASHIEVPHTTFALDNIRPDLLIFRAMGSSLVLWDDLEPTSVWLQKKIPKIIMDIFFPPKQNEEFAVDSEVQATQMSLRASFQIFLCLLSGYCWAISLRFAGTSDLQAKVLLLKQLRLLQCLRDGISPQWESLEFAYPQDVWKQEYEGQQRLTKPLRQKIMKSRMKKLLFAASEKASKPILEMCVTLTALSVSIACAGSGDLETLRILRALHSRVDDANYGTHLGIAMSIGLLFLGQGKASLKRDDISIASLIISTCPRYPLRTKDNQSHLQALRHIYVLAVEERCLQAVDVNSGVSSPLDVEVSLRNGSTMQIHIPALLPELSSIKYVRSLSPHHLPASLGEQCGLFGWNPKLPRGSLPQQDPRSSRILIQKQRPFYTTLFIKTLTPEKPESYSNISIKNSLRERAELTLDPIHSCPFARKVSLESNALNQQFSIELARWPHSLCFEVYLLRVLLLNFPFLRSDFHFPKVESSLNDYSLTELLSTADSILSMECTTLISNSKSIPALFQKLISCDSRSSRSHDALAFAFALSTVDLYPPAVQEQLITQVMGYLKTEEVVEVDDPKRLLSLVSSVGLAINKNNVE